jgi:hypothetical protein
MKGKVSAACGRAPIASPEDDLLLDCTDIKSKKQDNSEYDSLTYNHNILILQLLLSLSERGLEKLSINFELLIVTSLELIKDKELMFFIELIEESVTGVDERKLLPLSFGTVETTFLVGIGSFGKTLFGDDFNCGTLNLMLVLASFFVDISDLLLLLISFLKDKSNLLFKETLSR